MKLNLQFLTPADYLLRNFHLFRLEAAYEVREDLLVRGPGGGGGGYLLVRGGGAGGRSGRTCW